MPIIHMVNTVDERQPDDPPDIVERLREASCDREAFTPEHAQCACRLANEGADEIERLRRLIDGRDDFIVSKDLWVEFAGQPTRD